MPLLELDAYSVDFGDRPVLGSLSFRLARSQITGVVGARGAGKTVLARALGGLLPGEARASGRIVFDGQPLPHDENILARLRGNRIAVLLDETYAALDPQASIAVQLARQTRGDTGAATALLAACGIGAAQSAEYPHRLSAGERRLAMLAMALSRGPDLLVADDPARTLDPVAARTVLEALGRLVREKSTALLLLSEDPRAVAALCHDMMVLAGGRIVESGTPSEVFSRPHHEETRALVAAARPRVRPLTQPPIGAHLLAARNLAFASHPGADVNFEIRRSEALAIVGRATAGKTALARAVAGIDRLKRGVLMLEHDRYHGSDLPRHRRREISLMFAAPERSFDTRLPVGSAVTEPMRLEPQLLIEEQAERLMEIVRAVGIEPSALGERPAALDRLSLIRLALARALIARPRLLVADDFAEGLDLVERAEMLALFSRLRSDYGLSCLLLTRDIELARALADRALILDGGRIVEDGKPAELIEAPRAELTRALVGARLAEIGPPRAAP